MSEDVRAVPIDAEQHALIEEIGLELVAKDYARASKLLAIALAWRVSPAIRISPADQRARARVFRCEPDESAGMADVVELRGYSRKAPCG